MALTLDEANELIRLALEHGERYNRPLAVAVVDYGGFLLAVQRQDGAPPMSPLLALSKAYTAAVMQRPSVTLVPWAEHEPTFFGNLSRFGTFPIVATPAGVTIRRDGELLGGIGLSGAASADDQACADAALTALGFELEYDRWTRR